MALRVSDTEFKQEKKSYVLLCLFHSLHFCNGCRSARLGSVRLSLFLLNFLLFECLVLFFISFIFFATETHLQLIVVSMQHFYPSKWICSVFLFFFALSSGYISAFPLLLQQTDDSNCILLPIQHITYNFYHSFFLIFPFLLLVFAAPSCTLDVLV